MIVLFYDLYLYIFVLLLFMLKLFLIYMGIIDYLSGSIRSFHKKLDVNVYMVTGFMIGWWVMRWLYFGITTPIHFYMWVFFQRSLSFSKEYSILIPYSDTLVSREDIWVSFFIITEHWLISSLLCFDILDLNSISLKFCTSLVPCGKGRDVVL